MNKDLQDYVIQNRQRGADNEQIKQDLLSAGWPETEVNQALGLGGQPLGPFLSPPPPPPPPTPPAGQTVDLSGNKGMAILAYLGILIIVPFLTGAKNDPFVKFHLKQGVGLIILWFIVWILSFGLGIFFTLIRFPLSGLVSMFFPFLWLLTITLMIMGIINAATGKTKELPIVGSWVNKFNF